MRKSGSEPLIGEGIWELFGGLGKETKGLSKTVACSLREYSLNRNRLRQDTPPAPKSYTLERIDLAGGNGRWRQRKAKVEFAQRDIEEAELRRQAKQLEKERRRRREEKERERERRESEDLEKRKKEREKAREEALQKQRDRLAAAEAEAVRQQQEHLEWQRRQPKMCQDCQGSGKCPACDGKGYKFVMFLVPQVGASTTMEHGKIKQGCEECGGLSHNIIGDLHMGTGKCIPCQGFGKVTPVVIPTKSTGRRKYAMGFGDASSTPGLNRTSTQNPGDSPHSPATPGSPLSPTSPKFW